VEDRAIDESILVFEMLAKLDSQEEPGLTIDQLQLLLVRCECGMVTTRRAFDHHECLHEVIDLTADDSGSEAPTEIS
jgi:hypothetical protein